MNIDKNRYVFLGNLALKYRLSLENLCMIEKIPINKENKNSLYEKIILSNQERERAFKYLFNVENLGINPKDKFGEDRERLAKLGYETKGESTYKRFHANRYIEYLEIKQKLGLIDSSIKTPEVEELRKKCADLEKEIQPLDLEERQYRVTLEIYKLDQEVREKQGRPKRHITEHEALIASKYRLKLAIPREEICTEFGVEPSVFEKLEADYKDEIFKIRLNNLNEFLVARYFSGVRKNKKR